MLLGTVRYYTRDDAGKNGRRGLRQHGGWFFDRFLIEKSVATYYWSCSFVRAVALEIKLLRRVHLLAYKTRQKINK